MGEHHVADVELSAFLDDELAEDRALELTRHVLDCGRCRRSLEELRGAREALRGLPRLQAPVLTPVARPERRRMSRRLRRAVVGTTAGTLTAVVLLGGAYLAGDPTGEVEPPMDVYVADHLARTGGGPVPPTVGDGQR